MRALAILPLLFLMPAGAQDRATEQATVGDILQRTTEETGIRFVFAESTASVKNTVSFPAEMLKGKEAFDNCLKLCRLAGLAAVPAREGARPVWRIVSSALALKQDLRGFEKIEDLPGNDEFCRLTLALRNLSAREVHAMLVNSVTNPAAIFPLERAGHIMICDYAPNLRRLGELITRLDARTPAPIRDEYLVVFMLVKPGGEAGTEAKELPRALAGFAEALKSQVPYARYEVIDVGSVRVNVDPAVPRPREKDRPGPQPSVVLGGEEGFRVEFAPSVGRGDTVRLGKLTLLQLKEKQYPVETLSTSLTLKVGERAIVGACRPPKVGWPLILTAELKDVK